MIDAIKLKSPRLKTNRLDFEVKVQIVTNYDQVEFKNIHSLRNSQNLIYAKTWIHTKIYPNNVVHFDEFLYFYISNKNHNEHLVISFLLETNACKAV